MVNVTVNVGVIDEERGVTDKGELVGVNKGDGGCYKCTKCKDQRRLTLAGTCIIVTKTSLVYTILSLLRIKVDGICCTVLAGDLDSWKRILVFTAVM